MVKTVDSLTLSKSLCRGWQRMKIQELIGKCMVDPYLGGLGALGSIAISCDLDDMPRCSGSRVEL